MNEGATTASGSLNQKIMKSWDESTDSEKLELLRREIRNGRHLTTRIIHLQEDVNKLKAHTHDGFGQVVVPMHTVGASLGIATGSASMAHDPLA